MSNNFARPASQRRGRLLGIEAQRLIAEITQALDQSRVLGEGKFERLWLTRRPHLMVPKHGRASDSRRKLSLVLGLTAIYMVAEAVGGWWTGSLALLADAGHMLTDVAALGLALLAAWFSARPATSNKTFGYHRLEILAALVNGVTLVVISILILYEAYQRWAAPPIVRGSVVMFIATGGLAINLISAWVPSAVHETS